MRKFLRNTLTVCPISPVVWTNSCLSKLIDVQQRYEAATFSIRKSLFKCTLEFDRFLSPDFEHNSKVNIRSATFTWYVFSRFDSHTSVHYGALCNFFLLCWFFSDPSNNCRGVLLVIELHRAQLGGHCIAVKLRGFCGK